MCAADVYMCSGWMYFLIETSKFTKLHHPLFEQPEKSIGIILVKQHETINEYRSVWGMYLLDGSHSNPIITSTHSTL